MKIKYFPHTDTLHIEFRADRIAEACNLDEDTLLELDYQGRICAMAMEHASQRTDIPWFSYEEIEA